MLEPRFWIQEEYLRLPPRVRPTGLKWGPYQRTGDHLADPPPAEGASATARPSACEAPSGAAAPREDKS